MGFRTVQLSENVLYRINRSEFCYFKKVTDKGFNFVNLGGAKMFDKNLYQRSSKVGIVFNISDSIKLEIFMDSNPKEISFWQVRFEDLLDFQLQEYMKFKGFQTISVNTDILRIMYDADSSKYILSQYQD